MHFAIDAPRKGEIQETRSSIGLHRAVNFRVAWQAQQRVRCARSVHAGTIAHRGSLFYSESITCLGSRPDAICPLARTRVCLSVLARTDTQEPD